MYLELLNILCIETPTWYNYIVYHELLLWISINIAACFCRQPQHLKLQFTEHSLNGDLLSKFKSFSTNLVHLELVCRWSSTQELLTDLKWLQGMHDIARQVILWYILSNHVSSI